jgi:hypothetical protein
MNDYPRMLYAADGRMLTVLSENEEYEAGPTWEREPSDIHRSVRIHDAGTAPMPNDVLADLIAERVFAKIKALLEPAEPVKRGPGRPKVSLD